MALIASSDSSIAVSDIISSGDFYFLERGCFSVRPVAQDIRQLASSFGGKD